jgi:hypothetical protein
MAERVSAFSIHWIRFERPRFDWGREEGDLRPATVPSMVETWPAVRYSPEFTVFGVPATIDDGTSAKRKRRSLRTHQDSFWQRKSGTGGARLPPVDDEPLFTTVRHHEPSEPKFDEEKDRDDLGITTRSLSTNLQR